LIDIDELNRFAGAGLEALVTMGRQDAQDPA